MGIQTKHGLTVQEIALRWLQHHSRLLPTDGVILGASRKEQLEANVIDSEKGPLPDEVLAAVNRAGAIVQNKARWYTDV